MIAEFVQPGDVKAFDEFWSVAGDGATTLNDASVAANDFAGSPQLISATSWNQFANQQLAGPIAELAEAINSLETGCGAERLETGKNTSVVGGLVAVKKGSMPSNGPRESGMQPLPARRWRCWWWRRRHGGSGATPSMW